MCRCLYSQPGQPNMTLCAVNELMLSRRSLRRRQEQYSSIGGTYRVCRTLSALMGITGSVHELYASRRYNTGLGFNLMVY